LPEKLELFCTTLKKLLDSESTKLIKKSILQTFMQKTDFLGDLLCFETIFSTLYYSDLIRHSHSHASANAFFIECHVRVFPNNSPLA